MKATVIMIVMTIGDADEEEELVASINGLFIGNGGGDSVVGKIEN